MVALKLTLDLPAHHRIRSERAPLHRSHTLSSLICSHPTEAPFQTPLLSPGDPPPPRHWRRPRPLSHAPTTEDGCTLADYNIQRLCVSVSNSHPRLTLTTDAYSATPASPGATESCLASSDWRLGDSYEPRGDGRSCSTSGNRCLGELVTWLLPSRQTSCLDFGVFVTVKSYRQNMFICVKNCW